MVSYRISARRILGYVLLAGFLAAGCLLYFGRAAAIAGLAAGLAAGICFFLLLYHHIEKVPDLSRKSAARRVYYSWYVRFGLLVLTLALLGQVPPDAGGAAITGFFITPAAVFVNALAIIARQIADSKKIPRKG
jgi:hypothetical protein